MNCSITLCILTVLRSSQEQTIDISNCSNHKTFLQDSYIPEADSTQLSFLHCHSILPPSTYSFLQTLGRNCLFLMNFPFGKHTAFVLTKPNFRTAAEGAEMKIQCMLSTLWITLLKILYMSLNWGRERTTGSIGCFAA